MAHEFAFQIPTSLPATTTRELCSRLDLLAKYARFECSALLKFSADSLQLHALLTARWSNSSLQDLQSVPPFSPGRFHFCRLARGSYCTYFQALMSSIWDFFVLS
ncbi:hypothetical protein GOP47_0028025 [Adiantum capillus-veneris]|nr:hypothetical protein GOP47_0028025 [Adiantum capillus-veneris]